MKDKVLLGIGLVCILIALIKPDLNNYIPIRNTNKVNLVLPTINDEAKSQLQNIVESIKNGSGNRYEDGKRLASLYVDIGILISLNAENEVIKSTGDIKQANAIAGLLLQLDIKGKYPNLAKACSEYLISKIGDDDIVLDDNLRSKSTEAFNEIAWACNEGSK